MAELLNGKLVSDYLVDQLAERVHNRVQKGFRRPGLHAILVGNDPASETYVNAKIKACARAGFQGEVHHFAADASEDQVLMLVRSLNLRSDVHGFIVQLPLPPHIRESNIIMSIDPGKDVDGFHPLNQGKMLLGFPSLIPATPLGILQLIKHYKIETSGKHVVVVGRSSIVGTPISLLLSRNESWGNATVTLCHSKTKDLKAITSQADVLIAAIGKPLFFKSDMVKEGAVVIDVGIHRIPSETSGKFTLCGDCDTLSMMDKVAAITPVPGGVGPMTIAALLLNTWASCTGDFFFLRTENK